MPAIIAAGHAFERATTGRKARALKVTALRDYLIDEVMKGVPGAILMGDRRHRVPINAAFVFPGVDADYLAILMDREGVAVTPRSACLGSGGARADVAYALTGDEALSRAMIRFSLSSQTTQKEVLGAVRVLLACLPKARAFDR